MEDREESQHEAVESLDAPLLDEDAQEAGTLWDVAEPVEDPSPVTEDLVAGVNFLDYGLSDPGAKNRRHRNVSGIDEAPEAPVTAYEVQVAMRVLDLFTRYPLLGRDKQWEALALYVSPKPQDLREALERGEIDDLEEAYHLVYYGREYARSYAKIGEALGIDGEQARGLVRRGLGNLATALDLPVDAHNVHRTLRKAVAAKARAALETLQRSPEEQVRGLLREADRRGRRRK